MRALSRRTFKTDRERGPVEILCEEIGFQYSKDLERTDLFVAFVRVLVGHVERQRWLAEQIAPFSTNKNGPSPESAEALRLVREMLASNDPDSLIEKAAACHNYIHTVAPDDMYPCDHIIDQLSSCVSAIRFGLEKPCRSRHAAEAASHVWKCTYGITLFDEHSGAWEDEWACHQMQRAILSKLDPSSPTGETTA